MWAKDRHSVDYIEVNRFLALVAQAREAWPVATRTNDYNGCLHRLAREVCGKTMNLTNWRN